VSAIKNFMSTTLPIKILNIDNEGYHLIVKVKINNKVEKLDLDTGESKTVFEQTRISKFIKQKDFEKNDKLSTGLGTNSMESHFTTINKLIIGDIEIKNYKAVLLDLSHINVSYQQIGFSHVDGVLGSDILVDYKAVIDYEKKVLKLKKGIYKKKK